MTGNQTDVGLFEKIVNEMAEGVILVRASDLRIIFINQKVNAMFGYDDEELIGEHISILNYEDDEHNAKDIADGIEKKINQKNDMTIEIKNVTKDGMPVICRVHISSFDHPEYGEVWVNIHDDITKKTQAGKILRTSHEIFLSVMNNLDVSIYVADMKSYEILFINNYLENHFGKKLTGSICWESLQNNQKGPCEFCTNEKLLNSDGAPSEPYVWEHFNTILEKWYELRDQAIYWTDGRLVRLEIATDITDRKLVEQTQKKKNITLKTKVKERTAELEDMNAALKVLLKKREGDKSEMEERIFSNFEILILPFLKKLKNSLNKTKQHTLLSILESNLEEIISPFTKKLSDPMKNLSPAEIKVASLIKQGLSNKEIASTLSNSVRTVTNHRDHIRKKLDLKNKKINLQSFLSSL